MKTARLTAAIVTVSVAVACGAGPAKDGFDGSAPPGSPPGFGDGSTPPGDGGPALGEAGIPGDAGEGEGGQDCTSTSIDQQGCSCDTVGAMQPCYPGPAGTENKGSCHAGTQTCNSSGEFGTWGACTGSVVPTTEDCTGGMDTNCNGLVGCNDPTCTGMTGCCTSGNTRACYDGPSGTEGVGQCHGGAQVCDGTGAWDACTGEVLPGSESGNCNDGIDNDCNGLTDCKDPACFLALNCLFGCTANTTKSCYTGPSGTEGVGQCVGGTETCMSSGDGYGACTGEVLPGSEAGNCNDGIDNDCNGLTDCKDPVCETASNCCTPSSGTVDGTIWANSPDTLYQVDPTTFAVTTVGSFGTSDQMTDIALTPSGALYGISFTTLYSIDKTTGQATMIAAVPGVGNNCLTFLASGNLLAADGTGDLKSIDPTTGVTTDIGDYGDGLVAAGDLVAVASGTMYGVSSTTAGGGYATSSNILLRVDTTTGAGAAVGPTGYPDIWGLAYSNARVIGFTNGGQILQIDPQTGAATLISQNSIMFWGATQSPLVAGNGCP